MLILLFRIDDERNINETNPSSLAIDDQHSNVPTTSQSNDTVRCINSDRSLRRLHFVIEKPSFGCFHRISTFGIHVQ